MGSLSGASTANRTIPWAELEQRLADRRAAKAAGTERESARERLGPSTSRPWTPTPAPPESGVRTTAPRPLSYSVYTIADIEARARARARRSSSFTPPPPARWPDVQRSAVHLLRTFWRGWLVAPSPRPGLEDVCRVPVVQLAADLRVAVRALPWRTVTIVTGATLGVLLVLLGLVLAAAELTDDLKPARTSAIVPAPLSLAPPPADPVPADPVPAPAPAIEIDDTPPPAPAAAAALTAPVKPKPAAAKRTQEAEIFVP